MGLRFTRRSARRRAVVNAALAAHEQWHRECASVQRAYRRWISATPDGEALAFTAYWTALKREEAAADDYAELVRRVRQIAQVQRPPAETQARSGGRSL